MCGRYSNHVKAMLDWSALLGNWPESVAESNNISPSALVAGFTTSGGLAMHWGLIPPWSSDISSKYATFNARLEGIADKPTFKHAWRHSQRCLMPALGYYEWRLEAGAKQPYFIHHAGGEPLLLGGLYEPARKPGIPASCTILTQPSRNNLAELHNRMPLIVPLEQQQRWFDLEPDDVLEMAKMDFPPGLSYHPVSKRVNNSRHDDEQLTTAVETDVTGSQ